MYIHGSFYNKQDEKVTVLIVTKDDRTTFYLCTRKQV